MASFLKFTRSFCQPRKFLCKIEPDTYPLDAPVRNKPKVSAPFNYEVLPGVSPKIFRETEHEQSLGPIHVVGNVAKDFPYKNPEYFSYHNYSYYDIGRAVACAYRLQPSALPKGGKPFRVPWQQVEEESSADPVGFLNCERCEEEGSVDLPASKG
ncbi:uncharacterized protein LOC128278556 [Anopheles cruzii]|uniref:uncharacterized protein LOC128278556 n=1 Tax=Anopheles cruzii TaxID=68878 RepID=UPI0022EC40BE|nr:uncharacterized protein LOC128278556 [Anopheles cruzii]